MLRSISLEFKALHVFRAKIGRLLYVGRLDLVIIDIKGISKNNIIVFSYNDVVYSSDNPY